MKRMLFFVIAAICISGLVSVSYAIKQGRARNMSKEDQIEMARSAAPKSISEAATIMTYTPEGNLYEAIKGSNGFTCVSDIDDQETADPACFDAAGWQWFKDSIMKVPNPTNATPGVAYMGQGGWHWTKDKRVVMDKNTVGAKREKDPPHWMVLWPFDPKVTGLPTHPDGFGSYIMFDGTPYAHLMIHQDPMNLK